MPRSTTPRALAALLLTVALGVALAGGPSIAQAAPPPDPRAAAHHQEARRALATAQHLLRRTSARPTRDVTLALRDVALTLRYLRGDERSAARRLVIRPASDRRLCGGGVCVHWTDGQVDSTDTNVNGTPDWVETTLSTMRNVRQKYITAGYRTPKSDVSSSTNGGDNNFDVYLDDIGDSYYGYCTVDDDGIPQPDAPQVTWAYCVLDNDYSPVQFPTNTPVENLQVTAAHEYFHAIQFAYDLDEDRWLLEATATWAEDELYDAVDDNVQYLPWGPIGEPRVPLDNSDYDSLHMYGAWIFFRYLTERRPTESGGMPVLVREIWEEAGATPADGQQYSLEAVRAVAAKHSLNLPKAFAAFSDANLRPRSFYAEAVANHYPTAPPYRRTTLSPTTRTTGERTVTMKHLSSATIRFTPSTFSSTWQLKLKVNMDHYKPGAAAVVTTNFRSGATTTRSFTLGSTGNGTKSVPFSASAVRSVDLTLVNFGGRYTCDQVTDFTCHGTPKDDNAPEKYTATAFK